MEPIPSDRISPPHNQHDHQATTRHQPMQAFADRVLRALRHRLLLLYRSDPSFYVLGATGNVYIVNVTTSLTCTCPDRATPCKHILFVLIKVLGVSLDDSCIRKRTLRSCQLSRLLNTPSLPESLAGYRLRERFHQMFFLQRELGGAGHAPCTTVEEGTACPICLEEMGKAGDRLVACSTCRNPLHEECLMTWKRTQRRRSVSCVICRSRWRDRGDQDKYLNLSAYLSEDDRMNLQNSARTCDD